MERRLLDYLAQSCGCFISTLKYTPDSGLTLQLLRGLEPKRFSLSDWSYSLSYLFDEDLSFESYEQVEKFLLKKEKRAFHEK